MIELFKHNLPTYQKLKDNLANHDKVALLQATGTGKSYIIAKYIEESLLKTLILVPTIALQSQWSEISNADISTYAQMIKDYKKLQEYDLIIADEFHHLGSEVWGKVFEEELLHCGAKIIGASATEIRYLDNSRNMAEELFDGNIVRGVDLPTAIQKGILPSFIYVSVSYGVSFSEYEKKLSRLKRNTKREMLYDKLTLTKRNMISISDAVNKHLTGKNHKIIVFMNRTTTIEKEFQELAELLKADKVYKVTHKMTKCAIDNTLNSFKSDISGRSVLFAINILNEGIHISGVDCVVFMRNTRSPQIYFQQLGRCLAVDGAKTPIVFDFVCNSASLKSMHKSDDDIIRGMITKINKHPVAERIILFDYTKELNDLFDEIDTAIGGKPFTDEEVQFIKEHPNMNITELARALNRGESSIYLLATKHNINLRRHHQKLDDETREKILSMKGTKTYKQIAEELNVKYGTVCTILSPATKEKRKEYKDKGILNNPNISDKEVSMKLDLPVSLVRKYRWEKGIIAVKSNCKRVNMLDQDKKTILNTFESVSEASRFMKCNTANLSKAAKMGTRCSGYYWRFSK